jgi:hypothetical protein
MCKYPPPPSPLQIANHLFDEAVEDIYLRLTYRPDTLPNWPQLYPRPCRGKEEV